jgi:RND family efflux transporter MFP subunit
LLIPLVLAPLGGCRGAQHVSPGVENESWAVTAWGEHYEVFAETEGLAAGVSVVSNVHVTVLAGFTPLRSGAVSMVLRTVDNHEQVFRTEKPKRDGIFPVEAKPASQGEFDLLFYIDSPAGREEIAAGRVRVGSAGAPGTIIGASTEAEPGAVTFLKEQQWRTPFATAWATEGSLHASVSGPAKVRTVAGGEAALTAPVDARVVSEPWPHVGLNVAKGRPLFRLVPRFAERSLPALHADAAALEAEVGDARKRVERLERLLKVEATSVAELERTRAALVALEARLVAARQGLGAADGRGGLAGGLEVVAPWAGRVAEVSVSPGQTVAAGALLGRVVRLRPLWLEVALRPEDAAQLQGERLEVDVRRAGQDVPTRVRSARLVARAPELDPRTGTLAVTVEVDLLPLELPIGSVVEADLLLPGARTGVVVPLSALVQDAGATVLYVQPSGETFTRRAVRVLARQGGAALVVDLLPHERVVTVGGAAVRRASLLSSGAPEGHVH